MNYQVPTTTRRAHPYTHPPPVFLGGCSVQHCLARPTTADRTGLPDTSTIGVLDYPPNHRGCSSTTTTSTQLIVPAFIQHKSAFFAQQIQFSCVCVYNYCTTDGLFNARINAPLSSTVPPKTTRPLLRELKGEKNL